MRFVLDFLRPHDLLIDVGANIGVYSLLACSISHVDVLAFEPSTAARDRALENLTLNHLHSRVRMHSEAVGEVVGEARLTVGLDTLNRISLASTGGRQEPVSIVTLDSILSDADIARVSVVKIDVEGHEMPVLRGAHRLASHGLAVFIVENNSPAELEQFFARVGYHAYEYDPLLRSLTAVSARKTLNQNLLFIGDVSAVNERLGQNDLRFVDDRSCQLQANGSERRVAP